FLGVAIEGPSRDGFLFYPAYRTKGGSGSASEGAPPILPDGRPHDWTLEYTPEAPGAPGRITVTLDGRAQTLTMPPAHMAAGARFDRFGIVTTWIDGNGQQVYFDDLT